MDNLTSLLIIFEDQGKLLLPTKKNHKIIEKESLIRRPYSSNNEN